MIKKINKILIIFINVLFFLAGCALLIKTIVIDKIEIHWLATFLLSFGPFFVFLIFTLLKQKCEKNKILSIIFAIFAFILTGIITLYFIFIQLLLLLIGPTHDYTVHPTIETYKQKLNRYYPKNPFLFEHFPSSIPESATDFYCELQTYFNYLTFKTDKSYIDHIINKNKKNILRKDYAENICKSYKLCEGYSGIKQDDLVYILRRNPHSQNKDYTSGFITPQNNEKILFFFVEHELERFIDFFGYYYPQEEEYPFVIKHLPTEKYRIKHFPNTLPENSTNYLFRLENDPYGWDINYLSINTDKLYINDFLKKYENKILKKINYSEIDNYYKDISNELNIDINDKETFNVYILKNENDDYYYTSGFVISEKLQKVIFFYANYNLIVI